MKNKIDYRVGVHVLLIIMGITMIFPFLWMILTALKTDSETLIIPPTILPRRWMFENFKVAWQTLPFEQLYINTFLLIFWRVICAVITCSLAGYAFGRIEFVGKKFFFSLVLIQMMLPPQIFIIPQYYMVAKLGWLNSVKGLIFPGLVSAFGTFLLRQQYKILPNELEEAARLEGCNHFQIFLRIMMPLTKNTIIALGIFTALFAYKELMWPLIVNTTLDKMTLSSAIASFKGQYDNEYSLIMSASFLAMWPMLLLYLLFQKQFTEGIASTGSKG